MEKIIRQLVIVIGAVLFSLVAHAANDTKDTDANIYGHVINKKTSKHKYNVVNNTLKNISILRQCAAQINLCELIGNTIYLVRHMK